MSVSPRLRTMPLARWMSGKYYKTDGVWIFYDGGYVQIHHELWRYYSRECFRTRPKVTK